MPVENISQSKNEHTAAKANGIARNAIGWINQLINNSVQEISDFSALLSSQTNVEITKLEKVAPVVTVPPANSPMPSEAEKMATNPVVRTAVQSPSGKEILLPDRAKAVGLRDSNEESPAEDVEPEPELEPELDAQVLDESEDLPVEHEIDNSVDVVAPTDVTANTLVMELIASQTEVAPVKVSAQATNTGTAVEEPSLDVVDGQAVTAENGTPVNQEQLPESVEKDLVDFVRSTQKQASLDLKTQSALIENNSSSNNPANQAETIAEVVETKGLNVELKPRQTSNSEQNLNMAGSTKGPQFLVSPLSQAVAGSVSSNYARPSLAGLEENLKPGMEALSGSKFSPSSQKSASFDNSAILSQSGKSIDMSSSTSRSTTAAFAVNAAESLQRGENTKTLKPLSRGQSLATLEKVENALQKAAESKDGTLISLRLDPPSLGSVKVDVSFKEGVLHARLSADSAQVMQLLREKAPDLQVTLRKLGLDVDRVSVSVNSGDSGAFSGDSDGRKSGTGPRGGNNFSEMADFAASAESLKLDHWIA